MTTLSSEEYATLEDMEKSINRYVDDYDPCPICANKTEQGRKGICTGCAYFYPAKFKARRDKECMEVEK